MTKPPSVTADKQLTDELLELAHRDERLPFAGHASVSAQELERYLAGQKPGGKGEESAGGARAGAGSGPEAIVKKFGRPAMFVRNGRIDTPASTTWRDRLEPYLPFIEPLIAGVGRVEVVGHPDYDWIGTAWVIGERTVVTNRHVASIFAQAEGSGFRFRSFAGTRLESSVDFRREHESVGTRSIEVAEILFVSPDRDDAADVGILRLASHDGLPDPIELSDAEPEGWVAAIGYPGWDGQRNDAAVMARIFGETYGVKRFAPGRILDWSAGFTFTHDCSTLGGNSGSVLIDLAQGRAVGLHFAGTYGRENFAVKAAEIQRILGERKISLAVAGGEEAPKKRKKKKPAKDPIRDVEWFADGREGYVDGFLGGGKTVEPPAFGSWKSDVLDRLDYRHFSVVMARSRRMALYTAVNINGKKLLSFKRGDDLWYLDPRIKTEQQIGNAEAYTGNPLDRGHLVRRLDPVWGDQDVAKQAEEDTFHYTNSVPQHSALNQRTWLSLEDYVLNRTADEDMKACVFTGPILRDDDPPYRKIQLPREFWKVAVAVDKDTKKLSAAGYLLSHAAKIEGLGEEAPFGAFKTYQVPIRDLARDTGLEMKHLIAIDVWKDGGEEAPGRRPYRVVEGPDDVRLS
jgi:endonuclease G